jgi:hypothetical protein
MQVALGPQSLALGESVRAEPRSLTRFATLTLVQSGLKSVRRACTFSM